MTFKFPDEIEEENQDKTTESSKEDDIEVEVIDDTPEADRGRKPLEEEVADPTDDEIASYSEKVQQRLKKLTHARHDERRAKEAALREKQELENFARNLLEENQRIKKRAEQGSQILASQVKANAEQELVSAREKLKKAQEAFDTDAIIEAQEALTDAKLRVNQVESFKPVSLQEQEVAVQTQPQQTQAFTPDQQTLRWQAKNQWFGQPEFEEYTSFALGLHKKLVDSGVDPRSAEYFEKIDSRMRRNFPELFGGKDEQSEKTSSSRKPPTVVASSSRSTGGNKKVTLTASALALAKKFGLTPQQYAAQVARLESRNE